MAQYLQHRDIAADFAAYLALYHRYQDDYGVEEILTGQPKPAVYARLLSAPFDERLSLVSLLLAGLDTRFAAAAHLTAVTDLCFAVLKQFRAGLREQAVSDPAALYAALCDELRAETDRKAAASHLDKTDAAARRQAHRLLTEWAAALHGTTAETAFAAVKVGFDALNDERTRAEDTAGAALEFAFDFMLEAFEGGQELVVFVTELTLRPLASAYITENGCDRYYALSKNLLLDSRRDTLRRELAAEEARFGQL